MKSCAPVLETRGEFRQCHKRNHCIILMTGSATSASVMVRQFPHQAVVDRAACVKLKVCWMRSPDAVSQKLPSVGFLWLNTSRALVPIANAPCGFERNTSANASPANPATTPSRPTLRKSPPHPLLRQRRKKAQSSISRQPAWKKNSNRSVTSSLSGPPNMWALRKNLKTHRLSSRAREARLPLPQARLACSRRRPPSDQLHGMSQRFLLGR